MLFMALGWPPALLLRGSVRGFFIALVPLSTGRKTIYIAPIYISKICGACVKLSRGERSKSCTRMHKMCIAYSKKVARYGALKLLRSWSPGV